MLSEKCFLSLATMVVHPITLLSLQIQGTQLRGEINSHNKPVWQGPSQQEEELVCALLHETGHKVCPISPQLLLGSLEKSQGF